MENFPPYLKTNRYWQIFKRRWLPALVTFVTISSWGIISTAVKTNTYEAEAKLKFKKINSASSMTVLNREIEALSAVEDETNSLNTEAEVIQSTPLIKQTINKLNLKNNDGEPLKISTFQDKLNVLEIPKTDILKITYRDSEPQRAKKAVNTLVNNYLENNVAANKIEVVEAKKLLEQQIPEAKAQLLETENSIAKLKSNNQILSPEQEVSKLVSSLEELENRITDATSRLSNVNSQSQYIKKQLNMTAQQALKASNVSQSSEVQQIITQLQKLESQLKQELTRFGDRHPQIIDLKAKIQGQKQLLSQQIQKIIGVNNSLSEDNSQLGEIEQELAVELIKLESSSVGLTEQVAYLSEMKNTLEQKASNLPELEQQLNQLERQLTVSQKNYEQLENQLRWLDLLANQNLSKVRVISYATAPEAPVYSSSVGYLTAITFGLLGSAAIVYLLEAKDGSLRTVEKAKQLFGYNWLGIIPSFEETQVAPANPKKSQLAIAPLIIKEQPGSSVSESYRMLQSNLRFLKGDRKTQTVVITSSISGEGKSTVAANLAGAMAQVGHKVLLVDADLHAPTQHRIWNTYSDCGLSNLLTDNLDSRLATEQVMKNLSIIASGQIPLSPATLLDSYKMKNLMYYWAKNYDFVIIDSPALDKAADAPILGRMADGVLLVVKPEEINRTQASFAKETLQRSGINVLGLVFNDINPKIDASGHYYHPFEEKRTILEKKIESEPNKELWDTICQIAQESPKLRLSSATNPQQILETPIDQLEETINYLERDLEQLTILVKEQEDELFIKRQLVRKLQRKANLTPIPERFSIEQELAQEQENKQMLDRTLVGQRRNLERKKQILSQYQEILEVKQD